MKNKKPFNKKILKKFLGLLDKGYEIDLCLERFPDYRDELVSYVEMIGNFRDLKVLNIKEDYLERTLKDIYAKSRIEDLKSQNQISKKDLFIIRFRPPYLKPLTVFLSVFVFFSFSFAGTVYASTYTIPGETLYTVKRASESVQVTFTPYDREGNLYFKFLAIRLNEADILFQKSDDIVLSYAGNLLADIDYSYNKCLEHKYQGLNDGGKMKGRINKLKGEYSKKCQMQEMGQGKQNNGQNANGQCNNPDNRLQNNNISTEQQKNIQSGSITPDSLTGTNSINNQTGNQYNYDQGNNKDNGFQSNIIDSGTGKGQTADSTQEDDKSTETVNTGNQNTGVQGNSQGNSLK